MRFRVTSVAGSDTGPSLNEATVKLEDWLNASLGDGHFGEGVDQFTIVLISVDEAPKENSRWAMAHDKTGSYKNKFTGEQVRFISSAVLLSPSSFLPKSPSAILSDICLATMERLASRPKRVPRGFDYVRCSTAVSKALEVYANRVVEQSS